MGVKSILSADQKKILDIISADETISRSFYLTGGTALAEFYLHHRLSEDLDFFAEEEFAPQAISVFLKTISKTAGIKKVDFQPSFNRNLFFLHLSDGRVIKTEFTFFPFPRIEKKRKINKLYIDSLLDIAVNKLFTIYQNPRSRDFIDLYFIIKSEKLTIVDLIKKAKIKFDWHVDPLQLGTQFLKVTEVKDYPKMIKKIDHERWQEFFIEESKKFKKDILS